MLGGRQLIGGLSLVLVILALGNSENSEEPKCLSSSVDADMCDMFIGVLERRFLKSVRDVHVNDVKIFKKLNGSDVFLLGDTIRRLWDSGAIREILVVVHNIFKETDIPANFVNFIHITDFVIQYHVDLAREMINEKISKGDRRDPHKILVSIHPQVADTLRYDYRKVLQTFDKIKTDFETSDINLDPPFPDMWNMISHYYVHKTDSLTNTTLGPKVYLYILQRALNNLRKEIAALKDYDSFKKYVDIPHFENKFFISVTRRPCGAYTTAGYFLDVNSNKRNML